MAKKIIIVRHGDFYKDANGESLQGGVKEQLIRLSEKIRIKIGEQEKPLIFSSPAERAVKSTEIIADFFQTSFEKIDFLFSENEEDVNFPLVQELIAQQEPHSTIILVTHYEYTHWIPSLFMRSILNTSYRGGGARLGHAVIIDCDEKTDGYLNDD